MSEKLKKPYEISLWEDVLAIDSVTNEEYFQEKKLGIIGSDSMEAPFKCSQPLFVKNVNGVIKMSFTMYSKYFSEEVGDFVDNPYLDLLVNERKIKLKYDDEWYDFIIKNIQENSQNKTFTYQCEGLFINELSKNGFSLEFNSTLQNNTMAINEYTRKVLEGTDWELTAEDEVLLEELIEEPVYKLTVPEEFTAYNMDANNKEEQIYADEEIFFSYSSKNNKNFLYFLKPKSLDIEKDESTRVLKNVECYYIPITNELKWETFFPTAVNISTEYRGKFKTRRPKTHYDNILKRYVNVYSGKDFGVTEITYKAERKDGGGVKKGTVPSLTTVENHTNHGLAKTGTKNNGLFAEEASFSISNGKGSRKVYYITNKEAGYEFARRTCTEVFSIDNKDEDNEEASLFYFHSFITSKISSTNKAFKATVYYTSEENKPSGGWSTYNNWTTGSETSGLQKTFSFSGGQENINLNWLLSFKEKNAKHFYIAFEAADSWDEGDDHSFRFYNFSFSQEQYDEIYGYNTSTTVSEELVTNYFVGGDNFQPNSKLEIGGWNNNHKNIVSTASYLAKKTETDGVVQTSYGDDFSDILGSDKFYSLLALTPGNAMIKQTDEGDEEKAHFVFNDSIVEQRSALPLEGFAKNEEYIFEIEYCKYDGTNKVPQYNWANEADYIPSKKIEDDGLIVKLETYSLDKNENPYPNGQKTFFSANLYGDSIGPSKIGESLSTFEENLTHFYTKVSFDFSISYKELINPSNKIGFFFYNRNGEDITYLVKKIRFYKYIPREVVSETDQCDFLTPDNIFDKDNTYINSIKYYIPYENDETKTVLEPEDIEYLHEETFSSSEEISATVFTQKWKEDYEKQRSIETKESNRFNILQSLCETFETWIEFKVQHEEDGTIKRENGRYLKNISFIDYNDLPVYQPGFIYGINLNSIQRTLESSQIISKIIVKDNSNQAAKNGFCSISRAIENPTKENFFYDFSYYFNHQLLNYEETMSDLYNDYYASYGNYNVQAQGLNEELSKSSSCLSHSKSSLKIAEEAYDSTLDEIYERLEELRAITGQDISFNSDLLNITIDPDKIFGSEELIPNLLSLKNILKVYEAQKVAWEAKVSEDEVNYLEIKQQLEEILAQKQDLNESFYSKYSRFIQEGTWTSENYFDDDLYYFDAQNVMATSVSPKVTYSINVIDISGLNGYEMFKKDVGTHTYIQDEEFFGYLSTIDEQTGYVVKTPYKEEVIISEISHNLDNPEADKIVIQNFKNQFEDLFQRITATTQSLQFASGAYNRASNSVNPDGTFDADFLQNTLLTNAFQLVNPENETIIWDEEGIKIFDKKNLNRGVKLSDGKIFVTNNGGVKWNVAVSGEGVNFETLTTGILNTDKVLIGNSSNYNFRWDKVGINAYTTNQNAINYGKFVRFDQYGLYGYSKGSSNPDIAFQPTSIDQIKKNADFGLTWDGFFLKSRRRQGWIEIDSEDDFRVMTGTTENPSERIKIGRVSDNNYGIIIKNSVGDIVFKTTETGDIDITGAITATEGDIGGFKIEESYLYKDNGNLSVGISSSSSVVGYAFWAGANREDIDNAFFKVSHNGILFAEYANISGTIEATEGMIGGWHIIEGILYNTDNISSPEIWLSPQGKQGEVNNNTSNFVFYANGNFGIDSQGKMYAADADISGRIDVSENSTIAGFIIGSDTIQSQDGKIGISVNTNAFWATDKFIVTKEGLLTATGADISGIIRADEGYFNGKIQVGTTETYITIDGSENNSSIYSSNWVDKNGSTGWKIDKDGTAIFNNISLRGSLKCAVLEYGEVQAVGGIMMIRPSATIEKVIRFSDQASIVTIYIQLSNISLFNDDDYCKLCSEAEMNELIKDTSTGKAEDVSYSGINSFLGKITLTSAQEGANASITFVGLSDSDKEKLKTLELEGMGIVNLGQVGDIGLGLNSSTNDSMLAPTSFSVFSLEKAIYSNGSDSGFKRLEPHIILGKIPNQPEIYGTISGTYGLYADSAYLKGDFRTGSTVGGNYIHIKNENLSFFKNSRKTAEFFIKDTSSRASNDFKGLGLIIKDKLDDGTAGIFNFWFGDFGENDDERKVGNAVITITNGETFYPQYSATKNYIGIMGLTQFFDNLIVGFVPLSCGEKESNYEWYLRVGASDLEDEKEKLFGLRTKWIEIAEEEIIDEQGQKYIEGGWLAIDNCLTIGDFVSFTQEKTDLNSSEITINGELAINGILSIKERFKCSLEEETDFKFLATITDENGDITKEEMALELGEVGQGLIDLGLEQYKLISGNPEYVASATKIEDGIYSIKTRGKLPFIMSNGVMEIGRYIDFHFEDSEEGVNYDARIDVNSSGDLIFRANNKIIITKNTTVKENLTIDGDFTFVNSKWQTGDVSTYTDSIYASYKYGDDTQYFLLRNPGDQQENGSPAAVIGCRGSKLSGGNAWVWYINVNGNAKLNITGAPSSPSTVSDEKMKNSIENYSLKYSIFFDKLNPIRYKYNDGTSNRYHTGFIAQQVEKAILWSGLTTQDFAGFIRSIETETDPTSGEEIQVERCYLRYEEFIALNTNEIQKLKKRVTELETQLAELLNQQN